MHKIIFRIIVVILIGITIPTMAQYNLTLYNMKNIPQVVYTNPSFIPKGRINISIPTFSGIQLTAGKSAFKTQGFNLSGNLQGIIKQFHDGLGDKNTLLANTSLEVLHIGFSIQTNYFFLSVNDHLKANITFPKSFISSISDISDGAFLRHGVAFSNTQMEFSHVREYSLGWAKEINPKLSIGIRGKLLSGISSLYIDSLTFDLEPPQANSDFFAIMTLNAHTSGLSAYTTNPARIITGYDNYGYAMDLGFEYKITKKFKVAGSVIDLGGTIYWEDNVNDIQITTRNINLDPQVWIDSSGIHLKDLANSIYDSVFQDIKSDPSTTYISTTPTRFNGSVSYNLNPNLEATALTQISFYPDYFDSKFILGFQGRVKRFFNYMVSYTLPNGQTPPANLSLGLALNVGPIQFHIFSDNILFASNLDAAIQPSIIFGVNLTFNRDN